MINVPKGLNISPQRMGLQVLSQYQEKGFQNNTAALKVQLALHPVFIHQNYKLLPESLRIKLRRLQSLAFDGFFSTPEDIAEIEKDMETLEDEKYAFIRAAVDLSLQEIKTSLEKESKWMNLSDDIGENRTLTDARAVRLFAQLFRKRLLVWGSARFEVTSPDYDAARWLTESIITHTATPNGETETVLTGAGPGIMEAANLGALRARLQLINKNEKNEENSEALRATKESIRARIMSCGLRIKLPFEPGWNPHLQTSLTIKQFPLRKFGMVMCATGMSNADSDHQELAHQDHYGHPAIFAFNGGFGTVDEVMDALCLKQCNKMPKIPIYLIGAIYQTIRGALQSMVDLGTADRTDLDLAEFCTNEVDAYNRYLCHYNLHNDRTQKSMRSRKPTAIR